MSTQIKSTVEERARAALSFAREARERAENWIELNNAVFGIGGKMTELFPTESERIAFSRTKEFATISELIRELRECKGDPPVLGGLLDTANGTISIRLPRSVHAALLAEAKAEGVSLNQLCVAKLCVQLRAAV